MSLTIGRQHIVVKVQHENNDEKMVLATWEYNEYQFAIIGEVLIGWTDC